MALILEIKGTYLQILKKIFIFKVQNVLKVETLARMHRMRAAKFDDFGNGVVKIFLISSIVPVWKITKGTFSLHPTPELFCCNRTGFGKVAPQFSAKHYAAKFRLCLVWDSR